MLNNDLITRTAEFEYARRSAISSAQYAARVAEAYAGLLVSASPMTIAERADIERASETSANAAGRAQIACDVYTAAIADLRQGQT